MALSRPTFHSCIVVTDSILVASVEYDANLWILDTRLKNGKRYRYREVSPGDFALFVTAKSMGKAFNKYIAGLHKTRRLPLTGRKS